MAPLKIIFLPLYCDAFGVNDYEFYLFRDIFLTMAAFNFDPNCVGDGTAPLFDPVGRPLTRFLGDGTFLEDDVIPPLCSDCRDYPIFLKSI